MNVELEKNNHYIIYIITIVRIYKTLISIDGIVTVTYNHQYKITIILYIIIDYENQKAWLPYMNS